jgi:methionyl-tRNA formyltransferase
LHNLKIIFFGTSLFAARVFSFLVEQGLAPVAVVTRPDRQKGRSLHLSPPPVKEIAEKIKPELPVYQPIKASTPEFAEVLRGHHPDLFLVVAYGEIIKQSLLDIPGQGCINIHASLLPKYRGAAPIQRSLMDGVSETGITIIEMSAQMDAGAILEMRSLPVPEEMTFGELEEQLCRLACTTVLSVLHSLEKGSIHRTPQDHTQATLAPKLTSSEEEIQWGRPASQLHHLIRALSPLPGAWTWADIGGQKKRLKIKRSQFLKEYSGKPGSNLSYGKEGWLVACGEGALRLLEVQLEGKKSLPVEDFIKGMHQPPLLGSF